MPDPWPTAPAWPVAQYDEIDSTNAEALRRAARGERGPLWIAARRQTHGRGRSGRTWASAGESLAATLLFAPACEPAALAQLSLLAGVATLDAIRDALPPPTRHRARLKWPNDVLIGNAKASGILVESSSFGAEIVAAIGIGINIGAAPGLDGRLATCLRAHGASIGSDALLSTLSSHTSYWLARWGGGKAFASIRQAWLERAGPIGETLVVNAGQGRVSGTFGGLDSDGALLLDVCEGIRRTFTFGDVALGAPPA